VLPLIGVAALSDGGVPPEEDVQALSDALALRGHARDQWLRCPGCVALAPSPLPRLAALDSSPRSEPTIIATGCLTNHDDVVAALGAPPGTTHGDLIRLGYGQWGEECVHRFVGDWAMAVWTPSRRRLFLARDTWGISALFWAVSAGRAAFGTRLRPLLALPWVGIRPNELQVARLLVGHPPDLSETTYEGVFRVPSGEALILQGAGSRRWRYSQVEEIAERVSLDPPHGAATLRNQLSAAVGARLGGSGRIGTMLTGGLDSTSITAIAARALSKEGRGLTALTAVPAFPTEGWVGPGRFGDEAPLASALARSLPNVEHAVVASRNFTPLQGIREVLRRTGEPIHGASNAFWLTALMDEARRRGIKTVLMGHGGNNAMSWNGPAWTWRTMLRRKGAMLAARYAVGAFLPRRFKRSLARFYGPYWETFQLGRSPWRARSAINVGFTRDVGLSGVLAADPLSDQAYAGTPAGRASFFSRYATRSGAFWAQFAGSFGVAVRQPANDQALVTFALSLPAHVWEGPLDRWIFREAMRGVLPDCIRMNQQTGLQAADIVPRLRASRDELEATLTELENSALVRRCVDLEYCREIVAALDTGPHPYLTLAARMILMRGLSVGMFLSEFERPGVYG